MDPWCGAGQQCPAKEMLFKLEHFYADIRQLRKKCVLPRKAELKLNFEPKLHLCVDGSGSGNAEEQAGAASRQESAAGDAPAPA